MKTVATQTNACERAREPHETMYCCWVAAGARNYPMEIATGI